jgi:hypothetical protein
MMSSILDPNVFRFETSVKMDSRCKASAAIRTLDVVPRYIMHVIGLAKCKTKERKMGQVVSTMESCDQGEQFRTILAIWEIFNLELFLKNIVYLIHKKFLFKFDKICVL